MILALNATVDGQTTAHYITDLLHDANVKVTRLAHGVPVGGELDYLDEGTLSAAIKQRHAVLSASSRGCQPLRNARAAAARPAAAGSGMPASAQITKNHAQPVASAMKPAPDDR